MDKIKTVLVAYNILTEREAKLVAQYRLIRSNTRIPFANKEELEKLMETPPVEKKTWKT